MVFTKTYQNGLRLIVNKMDGLFSVSSGIMVKTGSANETAENNGISHFIEHCLFKGTKKRSSFEISDYIDSIGAQINAYTSKETTCFYTKSTYDHFEDTIEVLSDLFFNSVFDEKEIEKEKGVIIEEINMCEDTPEDLCLDILSESRYGKSGLGRTILGPSKNIKSFSRSDIFDYMNKYYNADNVVISVAGKVEIDEVEKIVEKYFVNNFSSKKSDLQFVSVPSQKSNLYKYKQIGQTHLGFSIPAVNIKDDTGDALNIASIVLGGSMSSRLFQKLREELGLCYSIYSYLSSYKDSGVLEIYAGINAENKDKAVDSVISEFIKMKDGINEKEFLRGKEQIKSSLIMRQESTSSQMMLYAKYLLFLNEKLDFDKKLEDVENITIDQVNGLIKKYFDENNISSAVVGQIKKPLKI